MMDEGLANLPRSWVWTRLGEIGLDRSQAIMPNKMPAEMFELYSVPSFDTAKPEIIFGKAIGSNKQVVDEGTVLLCKINPRINRVWIVGSHSSHPKIASTEWIPFFGQEGISPKYLCYFMRNSNFRDFLAMNVSGVGGSLMRIKANTLAHYPFPLPPLPEQHRIVAKIEELFTKLDAGIEALKKIKSQLKRYRRAVLKYAFEGKLTQEWREANKGKIEPASVLLEKIKEERKKEAKGKYKELPPVDTSELPELPEGWVWATIEHIVSDSLIGLVRSAYEQNSSGVGFPYIKMNNITMDGKVLLDDLVYIDATDEELEKYNIKEGDILFNTRNSLQLVGKTGIVRGITKNILYNNNLMRIRTFNGVSPTFLAYQVCSIDFRKRMEKVKRATTNVAAIYAKDLMPLFFILPPYIEQLKIIEAIESRLSVADELEKVVEQTLKQSERLRQSILKQAFGGKLVPQDPSDEPAERLLERIKIEKTKLANESKIKSVWRKRHD